MELAGIQLKGKRNNIAVLGGKLEVDLRELREFLVISKRTGYASGRCQKLVGGMNSHRHERKNISYVDNYFGHKQFSGVETVRLIVPNESWPVIWTMHYHGGMLADDEGLMKRTYAFLMEKLEQVDKKNPFRGLVFGKNNKDVKEDFQDLEYLCYLTDCSEPNIVRFQGREQINHIQGEKHIPVYQLQFMGGLVVPK